MSAWGNLLSLSKSGRTKKIVTLWFIGGTRTQADKKYVCSKFPIFDPPRSTSSFLFVLNVLPTLAYICLVNYPLPLSKKDPQILWIFDEKLGSEKRK